MPDVMLTQQRNGPSIFPCITSHPPHSLVDEVRASTHSHTEKQAMRTGLLGWVKTAYTSKWSGGVGQRRGPESTLLLAVAPLGFESVQCPVEWA